jgi:hypothetical protein
MIRAGSDHISQFGCDIDWDAVSAARQSAILRGVFEAMMAQSGQRKAVSV